YNGQGAFGGWIRRIMVNESLNFIRYQKNLFIEADEENFRDLSYEGVQEQMNADHLMKMIDDLPLGYKTVFNLFAIEGYSHKEIGDMLNISENTSKSQLSKARKYLQNRLGEQEILYKEK